jgi:uncharacterized membrane protein
MSSPPIIQSSDRVSVLLRIVSFSILVLGALVLAFRWDSIPDRWAVHWNNSGQPDRWTTKAAESFLPFAEGVLLCGFLELVLWVGKANPRRREDLPVATATAIASLTADFVRYLETAIAISFVLMGLLPVFRGLSPERFVTFSLLVTFGAIVLGGARIWRGVRRLKRAGYKGLEGYGGIAYNPADRRLWVPRLSGLGYTLNFANRWAWPILIAMLAIPVMFVLVLVTR